jgi:hypothetical protein
MSDGGGLLADWLTEEEVAVQLRHCEQTPRRWRASGIGPPFSRNGRQFIYHKGDVNSWLRAGGIAAPKQSQQRRGVARA